MLQVHRKEGLERESGIGEACWPSTFFDAVDVKNAGFIAITLGVMRVAVIVKLVLLQGISSDVTAQRGNQSSWLFCGLLGPA